jgi:hypothetical protein
MRTLAEINQLNREFWREEQVVTDRLMKKSMVLKKTVELVNEEDRHAPIYSRKSWDYLEHDGAFASYIARPKTSPAPAIAVLQGLFGVNAGSAQDIRDDLRLRFDGLIDSYEMTLLKIGFDQFKNCSSYVVHGCPPETMASLPEVA